MQKWCLSGREFFPLSLKEALCVASSLCCLFPYFVCSGRNFNRPAEPEPLLSLRVTGLQRERKAQSKRLS